MSDILHTVRIKHDISEKRRRREREEQARLLSRVVTNIMIVFVVINYIINKNSVARKRVVRFRLMSLYVFSQYT